MDPTQYLNKIEMIRTEIAKTLMWTLYGGNDPDDHGDVRAAADELGRHLLSVLELLEEWCKNGVNLV